MIHDLRAFLQTVTEPLAVRSSSILEDSHNLPLAGHIFSSVSGVVGRPTYGWASASAELRFLA
jgi:hypothetical protein